MHRGKNHYRYYSSRQLALCNTIRLMLKIGLPIAEIKLLKDWRTPEAIKEILLRQIDELREKKVELDETEKLLKTFLHSVQAGMGADTDSISIRYLQAEPIMLGEPNDYSGGKTDYDALRIFYRTITEKHPKSEYNASYPVWAIFSQERVKKGDWKYPDRYYYYNPDGKDRRPAATYAIGHTHTGYGQGFELYEKMLDYIDQSGFEICGDAYEEYPINEVAVADHADYLMRLLITVREKR